MRPARTALYETADPFVVNLCRFAQEGGYRRLVVVLQSKEPLDRIMAGRYREECVARKIQLTLLEDAYRRPTRYEQSLRIPESLEPDTLVVRLRLFRTNLDTIFHTKKGGHRALGIYQERSGDRDVRLPPTSDDPLAGKYDPTLPFPNLVYKMERDMGRGIVFLKASSLENARELVTRQIDRIRPTKLSARVYSSAYHLFEDERGVFAAVHRRPASGRTASLLRPRSRPPDARWSTISVCASDGLHDACSPGVARRNRAGPCALLLGRRCGQRPIRFASPGGGARRREGRSRRRTGPLPRPRSTASRRIPRNEPRDAAGYPSSRADVRPR